MLVNEMGAFVFRQLLQTKNKAEAELTLTAVQILLDTKQPLDIQSLEAKVAELRERLSNGESIDDRKPNNPIPSGPKR